MHGVDDTYMLGEAAFYRKIQDFLRLLASAVAVDAATENVFTALHVARFEAREACDEVMEIPYVVKAVFA